MTPEQCRAARALLQWSQTQLAQNAGVGMRTVFRFESGRRRPQQRTLAAMRSALEAAGVEFASASQSGVRLQSAVPSLCEIREMLECVRGGDMQEVERAIQRIDRELDQGGPAITKERPGHPSGR